MTAAACGDDTTEGSGTTGDEDDDSNDTESESSPTVSATAPATTVNPDTDSSSTTDPTDTDPTDTDPTDPSTSTTDPTDTTTTDPTTDGTTTTGDTDGSTTTGDTDGSTTTGDETTTTGVGDCIEVTPGELEAPQAGLFRFTADQLGDADDDFTQFEFYTNDTGAFDLASAGVNDNYISCEQCVRVLEDINEDPLVQYFQSEGTITVSMDTPPQDGALSVDLAGVTLVEVTIADDFTSTPVPNGGCVTITDGTYATPTVEGWNCDIGFYGTGDGCDCGCGIVDPDCTDATVGSCEFCNDTGSCDTTGNDCPGIIDAVDNSQCSMDPPAEWTCGDAAYADGTCDCGCGAFDALDCADATIDSCVSCNTTGSCAEGEVDCATISVADTTGCASASCTPEQELDAPLDGTEDTFNRPFANADGTGCALSGTGTAVFHDVYAYTLAGGPTSYQVSTCGNADFDSVLAVYQAADGSADPFNPADACANLVGYNDDNAGLGCGATSAVDVADLVDGDIQVVVTSFGNDTTGTYTLDLICL